MEEKKKNKGLIAVIIILIIVVLGLIAYIIYPKFFPNEEMKTPSNQKENENQTQEVTVDSYFKKSVTKDITDSCGNEKKETYTIDVPYITSEKENAVKLNNQILERLKPDYDALMNNFESEITKYQGVKVSYNYLIKNDIIYIYMQTQYIPQGCGVNGINDYSNYFYDINNDKILSLQEGFESLGYDLNSLKEYEISSYEECSQNAVKDACGCGLQIDDNGNITPFNHLQCV